METLVKFLKEEVTSKKIESKGQRLYLLGKLFMVIGVAALALAVIIGLISLMTGAEFISPFIFDIGDEYAFAYPFVVIDYIGILLGLCGPILYCSGISLYGIGRIAVNTEKE